MASIGLVSRHTCTIFYRRIHNDLLFSQNSQRIVQPVTQVICMNKRWRASKHSKFPKEDGVTKLKELAMKFHPPPNKRDMDVDIPHDSGVKVDSTGQVFSQYIPQKKKSAGQVWVATKAMARSLYSIAMIKRKDKKKFKVKEFAQIAQKKFIDLNTDLQLKQNKSVDLRMKENATLLVLRALKGQFHNPGKTVYWRFIKELEAPKVVNAAVGNVGDKSNMFAQVTVQMYTEQVLAIRDRYDRIITGSLKNARKVTDYVVFEKPLGDPYGGWRVCGKVDNQQV